MNLMIPIAGARGSSGVAHFRMWTGAGEVLVKVRWRVTASGVAERRVKEMETGMSDVECGCVVAISEPKESNLVVGEDGKDMLPPQKPVEKQEKAM
jgi:hypothetical protein